MAEPSQAVVVADDHHHTSMGLDNLKLAFWTFLGSDCFFFGALIGMYMSYRGQSLVGPYPRDVFSVEITTISTFLLLMSSLTMVLAVHNAKQRKKRATQGWMLGTALLGTLFVAFQIFEFTEFYHYGVTLQGNLFGSSFYLLTGFHGVHVTVGIIWLLTGILWIEKNWVRGDLGTIVDVTGLYWHFVDIVWIVIFTVVYLLEFVE